MSSQVNSTNPSTVFALESQHEENINDCQYDFYGTQLASCDGNGFIQITSIKQNGVQEKLQTFQAHEGAVWQVAWAHPKYESVIATCGYDNKVKVWRKDHQGSWENCVFQHELGESVNCIQWAPWEYGLILAAGTAEGRIHIFTKAAKEGEWANFGFPAHADGVNGLSWGPSTEPSMLSQTSDNKKYALPPKRLLSGGNDNKVKIWEFREGNEHKPSEQLVGSHDDWVRDVSWCDSIGLSQNMIATCSEDRTCKVWKFDGKAQWIEKKISFQVPLWKVSWSQIGNLLAISGADNKVHVMSEEPNGEWKEIQQISEEFAQEASANNAHK